MYDPYQTQPIPPQPVPYGGAAPAPQPMPYGGAAPAPQPMPYGGTAPAPQPMPYGGTAPAPQPMPYGGTVPVPQPMPYGGTALALPAYYGAVPAFTPEGLGKDPSRKASARDVNRMTLLCLGQMALSAGCGFVFSLVFLLGGIDPFAPDGYALSTLTAASIVLSTGVVPFLFFVAGRRPTVDYLQFKKVGFFPSLLCVLAGTALLLLCNIPAAFVQQALEGVGYTPTEVATSGEAGTWLGFAIDFVGIALLGPMLEEMMYRGIILTTLRKYGTGFAVAGSGLLFGLNHLDLTTAIAAVLAGFVLGAFYARTGNLWLTVWMHMLNNAFALAGQYADLLWPQDPDGLIIVLEIGLLGLGLLSGILLLALRRRVFPPPEPGPGEPFGPGRSLSALARAPMLWAMLALVGVYFALNLL